MICRNEYIKDKYMPEFDLYSKQSVLNMLYDYGTVFIKPDESTGNRGVIRLRLVENGKIELMDSYGKVKEIDESTLPEWSQTRYFVQEAIDSIGYDGRSVEVRVYLQRMQSTWEVRAIIPKIAPDAEKFSSVSYRGGTTLPFVDVFGDESEELERELKNACLLMSDELTKHITGLRELGFDMGVDKHYNTRYIEVNTRPALGAVRLTKNMVLYETINQYKQILQKIDTEEVKF